MLCPRQCSNHCPYITLVPSLKGHKHLFYIWDTQDQPAWKSVTSGWRPELFIR